MHNSVAWLGLKGASVTCFPTSVMGATKIWVTARAGEIAPRAAGYKPGVNHASFAIEKRAGGHLFQLNFSNAIGTTMGQIARGGANNDDWYMGFNISRKFF